MNIAEFLLPGMPGSENLTGQEVKVWLSPQATKTFLAKLLLPGRLFFVSRACRIIITSVNM